MKYLKNKNLKQKAIILVLIFVLCFVFFNFLRAWLKGNQVNKEIDGLEQEISGLQKDTAELTELIQYFNSSAYVEEKARVDLGLKKEGEKVVLVTDDLKKNLLENDSANNAEESQSNFKKWWGYFFK